MFYVVALPVVYLVHLADTWLTEISLLFSPLPSTWQQHRSDVVVRRLLMPMSEAGTVSWLLVMWKSTRERSMRPS